MLYYIIPSLTALSFLHYTCVLCCAALCCAVLCQGQAANTANRRVLVTDKNGKQSVQTINDELGMNGKDMADVKRRLGKQGLDTTNVEMYGTGENRTDKPSSTVRHVCGVCIGAHVGSMAITVKCTPRLCCAVLSVFHPDGGSQRQCTEQ